MPELKTLFFFFIEEAALLAYLGLALLGIRLSFKKAALVGLLQGIMVFLVRSFYFKMEIPFGTHTIILVITMIILLRFIAKVKWGIAAAAALMGFIIIILSESLLIPPVYEGLNLTLEKVLSAGWLNIVMGYACDAFVILLTIFVYAKKVVLIQLTGQE